jgi:ketosteroid isomerase-like protein
MSQENVDAVRRAHAALNSGDEDVLRRCWHPDVELRDLAHAADTTETVTGSDSVLALLSQWRETFSDFRAEVSEYVDLGDHVACVTRWVGTGRVSDASVDVSQVDLYELRDGQIVRATLAFSSKEAALAATGLSE